jgi:hypothetical protein
MVMALPYLDPAFMQDMKPRDKIPIIKLMFNANLCSNLLESYFFASLRQVVKPAQHSHKDRLRRLKLASLTRIAEVRVVHYVQPVLECESAMRRPAGTCRSATSKKGLKKSIAFRYMARLYSVRISLRFHLDQGRLTLSSRSSPQHRRWGNL